MTISGNISFSKLLGDFFCCRLENYGILINHLDIESIGLNEENQILEDWFTGMQKISHSTGEEFLFKVRKYDKVGLIKI